MEGGGGGREGGREGGKREIHLYCNPNPSLLYTTAGFSPEKKVEQQDDHGMNNS